MNEFRLNEQIARLRKKKGLTQEAFASIIGVSNQAVSKWETGACCPDVQLLPAIADLFGVSIDSLFRMDDKETRAKLLTRYECTGVDEDFKAAEKAYEKVILSGSAATEDLRDYAYLFRMRGIEYFNKAMKLYENALVLGEKQRDESWYLVHSDLIRMQSWRGKNAECVAKYKEMVRNEPDNRWAYDLLILCYMQAGRTEEAWQVTEDALGRFPGNAFLHTAAGELCADMGRYDDACRYWEMAIAEDPTQATSLYDEAFLLEKLGRTEEAIEAWRRLIRWHHEHNWVGNRETDMPQEHLNKLLSMSSSPK